MPPSLPRRRLEPRVLALVSILVLPLVRPLFQPLVRPPPFRPTAFHLPPLVLPLVLVLVLVLVPVPVPVPLVGQCPMPRLESRRWRTDYGGPPPSPEEEVGQLSPVPSSQRGRPVGCSGMVVSLGPKPPCLISAAATVAVLTLQGVLA